MIDLQGGVIQAEALPKQRLHVATRSVAVALSGHQYVR
jgi:hypothetical protein